MVKGQPKFDGLAIGQLSANFTRETLHLEATAGFVDSTTGETHGWTKADGRVWSKETMSKLKELQLSMELDMAKLHLSDADSAVTESAKRSPSGIGEALGTTTDAPSV